MEISHFALLCLILIIGTVTSYRATRAESRINTGVPIPIEEAPYQILYKVNNKYICGGALVSNYHVLTAAHCVKKVLEEKQSSFVVVGTATTGLYPGHEKDDGSTEIAVESIKIHPQYIERSPYEYDIAIIRLAQPVEQSNKVKPIEMPKRNVGLQDVLTVTGIGKLSEESKEVSPYLKTYDTRVVDCQWLLPKVFMKPYPSLTCHWDNGGSRTTPGDSGSPIINSRKELACIHNRGFPTLQTCTNVFHVRKWIYDNLK